jgi:hypothetical protein
MSNKGANNEAIVAITTVDHLLRYTLKGANYGPTTRESPQEELTSASRYQSVFAK